MNIVVCVKHIPDPNLPGELDADNRLKREGVQGVLDPGDEFGVEAGLQLKEAQGGEVTLVSMGPATAQEAVRRGLSMGADKGVLVTDDSLKGADAYVTAKVLAEAIKKESPDLVIAGVESTDGYSGTMASTLAEFLGLPQVTFVKSIESAEGTLKVDRQTADGYHVVECPLPALITVTAGINEPRYASFKGIMAAKKKPLEQVGLSELGLSADDVKSWQNVTTVADAEARKAGEVIEDDGTGAAKIADFLKEAKVI
ncbi:MAG TPA: electron transfer flavoprotein subunit beta/FixA family protein [Actinomycetota bacterium]|nr:electron transfer flavoprotein subunit beta/FixA family protein [Actinomycetota bacterium]